MSSLPLLLQPKLSLFLVNFSLIEDHVDRYIHFIANYFAYLFVWFQVALGQERVVL